MEERRLEGGRLLKAGKLEPSRNCATPGSQPSHRERLGKTVEAKGIRGLRKRKAAGSSSKLNAQQKQKLKYMLERGALANGFPTDRWTLKRVQRLIQQKFEAERLAKDKKVAAARRRNRVLG